MAFSKLIFHPSILLQEGRAFCGEHSLYRESDFRKVKRKEECQKSVHIRGLAVQREQTLQGIDLIKP
jgi:hypothetical protein